MNTMSFVFILVALLAGAGLGAAIVWWLQKDRGAKDQKQAVELAVEKVRSEHSGEIAALHERLNARTQDMARLDNSLEKADQVRREALEAQHRDYEQRIALMDERIERLSRENSEYQSAIRETEMELRKERESTAEKLKLLEEAGQQLSASFEALSRKALDNNNQSFLALAQTQLGSMHEQARGELEKREKAVETLVKPVAETLQKFERSFNELERQRAGQHGELKESIQQVLAAEKALHSSAEGLTSALRGKSTGYGRWGERTLENVVKAANMQEHVDFTTQMHVQAEDGAQRPDMVVHMPSGGSIVVDSKAPLEAFIQATETQDPEQRRLLLLAHAERVKSHIKTLGQKAYWQSLPDSAEFVVMFIPLDSAYAAAFETDPSLLDFGIGHKVFLATPITLLALLRVVAQGWRQEQLAQNAREISELGKDLYKRMRTLAAHFQRVGKNLGQATEAYNDAVGSLERSVLPQTKRFKALGAGTGDEIPALDQLDVTPRALSASELLLEIETEEEGDIQALGTG